MEGLTWVCDTALPARPCTSSPSPANATQYARWVGTGDGPGAVASWRKILYVQQPFPDNYIDASFLDELQRNGTGRPCARARDATLAVPVRATVLIRGIDRAACAGPVQSSQCAHVRLLGSGRAVDGHLAAHQQRRTVRGTVHLHDESPSVRRSRAGPRHHAVRFGLRGVGAARVAAKPQCSVPVFPYASPQAPANGTRARGVPALTRWPPQRCAARSLPTPGPRRGRRTQS